MSHYIKKSEPVPVPASFSSKRMYNELAEKLRGSVPGKDYFEFNWEPFGGNNQHLADVLVRGAMLRRGLRVHLHFNNENKIAKITLQGGE